MVLLSYAAAAASSAGSYAVSTASSYVFRSDASTSTAPSPASSCKSSKSASSFMPATPAHAARQNGASKKGASSPALNRRLSVRRGQSRSRLPSAARPLATEPPIEERGGAEDLVDTVNLEEDLYAILGVGRKAKTDEIRRAFLARSRIIHPDKLPLYPPATTAFQRLSYAYETLSKPSSRRLYDLGGGRGYDAAMSPAPSDNMADETLNSVLRNVINEFLNGDFEMIRVFVTAMNESNPGLNIGDEAVDSVEGAFRRVREVLLAGSRYLSLIKFELCRLYEIQSSLRSLSYFDVYGRLRLTLALTRVTLEIPMVLDKAMREELPAPSPSPATDSSRKRGDSRSSRPAPDGGQLERRGLLGTKTRGMLVLTCKMLEKAERWAGMPSSPTSSAKATS